MLKFIKKLVGRTKKKREDFGGFLGKVTLPNAPRVDTVPNATGAFGYDASNPIPVHLPMGEKAYLSCLRCDCGEPFLFERKGSCGMGPDGHIVDHFELVCLTKRHRIQLYMDMYHMGPSTLVPQGLTRTIEKPFILHVL